MSTRFSGKPSVSVAVATFNGEHHLKEQLESIRAQTLVPHEVIVGDDGSTDATREIVEHFCRETPSIDVRWSPSGSRLGTAKNFERLVDQCRGDLIAFADQDDVWLPHKLERMRCEFGRDEKVAFAFSDGETIDERGRPLGNTIFRGIGFTPARKARFRSQAPFETLLQANCVTGATLVARRSALMRTLPIPEGWLHDYYFALALLIGGQGVLVDEPLIGYRIHSEQQVGLIGSPSLRKLRGLALRQDAGYCEAQVQAFRSLKERVEALDPSPPRRMLGMLDAKIDFMDQRAVLRRQPERAPALIFQMWHGDHYRRQGLGFPHLAVDFLSAAHALRDRCR